MGVLVEIDISGKTKKQEAYIAYGGDKEMLKLYEEAKSTLLR